MIESTATDLLVNSKRVQIKHSSNSTVGNGANYFVGSFRRYGQKNGRACLTPYKETDFDVFCPILYDINEENPTFLYILPKSVLIRLGIMRSEKHAGVMRFVLYPNEDISHSRQKKYSALNKYRIPLKNGKISEGDLPSKIVEDVFGEPNVC